MFMNLYATLASWFLFCGSLNWQALSWECIFIISTVLHGSIVLTDNISHNRTLFLCRFKPPLLPPVSCSTWPYYRVSSRCFLEARLLSQVGVRREKYRKMFIGFLPIVSHVFFHLTWNVASVTARSFSVATEMANSICSIVSLDTLVSWWMWRFTDHEKEPKMFP